MENISVSVRFRPRNKKEEDKNNICLDCKNNTIELFENKDIHKFIYDYVFDDTSSQEHIFNTIAKNVIDYICQGYNATIFAYGATSSGKTHTMFGSEKDPGIIPRCCNYLFQIINTKEEVIEANMKCSFLEIYKEHIRDLLTPSSDVSLKLRQNPLKGIYIQGLLEKYVYSPCDIIETINNGITNRTTAFTSLNSVSSRSHAVVILNLTQKLSDGSEIISKLYLVDLAGSENVSKSEVQGITLTEAQNINKSLSCLGNVISALTEKNREHIPYRDSKLTYLLQDSLGGNAKTVLIATISSCYSETMSTLKFAKRVKEIKNIPKINKNESVSNLLQTIENLNKKIIELEKCCEDNKIIINAVEQTGHETKEIILLKTKCERLEKKISYIEENKKQTDKEIMNLFEKERDLVNKTSEDLYKLRLINNDNVNELEKLKMFYKSIYSAINTPEILKHIMDRFKLENE